MIHIRKKCFFKKGQFFWSPTVVFSGVQSTPKNLPKKIKIKIFGLVIFSLKGHHHTPKFISLGSKSGFSDLKS